MALITRTSYFNIIVALGFLIAAAFVVAVGFVTNKALQQVVETVESISEPVPVVVRLRKVQSGIADSEKVLRAYSITRNREYFTLYVELQKDIQNNLEVLMNSSEKLPLGIVQEINTIDKLLQDKLEIFNEYLTIKGEDTINSGLEKSRAKRESGLPGIIPEEESTISPRDEAAPSLDFEAMMAEIENVLEKQRQKDRLRARSLTSREMELAERDRELTEEMQTSISTIETAIEKVDARKAMEARQSAMLAIRMITGFIVAGVIIAVFLVYFIIKYNLQNVQYRDELILAKESAERNARLKEEFMANMSHEIRTPMNVIMGFTEQLQKPGPNLNQKMYLNGIRRSTEHLLRLINDILDYSKIESGKLNIESIGFKWKEILDDVYLLLREKAEEKNLIFGYTIKDDIPDVLMGDPVRLKQILINLVDNAIKFTPEGKVEIICERVHESNSLIELRFTVKDTGIGINKNKLQDIFEEFSQADSGTARKFGGSGLGLSICKKLVELQGGQISARSIEGKGSEFTFDITYKKGGEADINVEKPLTNLSLDNLQGKRVLVVDDEEFNRQLARVILEQHQVAVEEADNGLIAMEKIQENQFDAVLLDIQMPGLNGIDVIKLIRQFDHDPEKANIPVIALTANAKKSDQELYLKAGMSDYLSKPFKEEELLQKLAKVLNFKPCIQEKAIKENKEKEATEETLFNLDELKKITRGDEVFLKKIIELFIDNTPASTQKMWSSMREENWQTVGMIAHKMRPSFAHMGMKDMAEKLRRIEENANEGMELEETKALVEEFCKNSEKVVNQLQNLINHYH